MDTLDTLKQFGSGITIADVIILLPGLTVLGVWLLKTSFGKKALADSAPRRNNMPVYLPFVPLLLWFGIVSLAITITSNLLPDLPDWQGAFLDNAYLCTGAIIAMAIIIFLAKAHFVRRLNGFGLNVKTIHKDFFAAILNLLSAWPIVVLMIVLTTFIGQLIWGQEFKMQQHEELELITAYSELPVRVMIIITTIAVVPVFEELLFRGLFQTMIRSIILKPWLSIVISSGLFALAHYEPTHWPALFALSACMGYAYEKSGSLFRPIFIHSLFNATSVIAALYQ